MFDTVQKHIHLLKNLGSIWKEATLQALHPSTEAITNHLRWQRVRKDKKEYKNFQTTQFIWKLISSE